MSFKKGKERTGGRQKGTPNKTTIAAKEAFQTAFDSIGGAKALGVWANDNKAEFYKLYGRLIPIEANATIEKKMTLEELVLASMKIPPRTIDHED